MKKLALSLLFVAAAACGGPLKYMPKSTAKAPGVEIKVVADVHEKEAITKLMIEAVHLPPPNAVKEGHKHYVVWQRADSSKTWTRIAGLKYDESARVGKLVDVSVPATAFELECTAEEKPDVTTPSSELVFEQIVNK
jgi:hypothetical protein